MEKVRTRFAPSPTGYLHIGGLRTALYGYLYAKRYGGEFILRIEDTDTARYVDGSVQIIYDTMRDSGIMYDEGPDVGGNYGPYVQSERKSIYTEYAKKLVELGGAYYCFCTPERIETLKDETGNVRYDKHCQKLSKEEIEQKIASGQPYVIRQNVPESGTGTYNDLVYGEISVDYKDIEDGILIKSDGMPTYNFANVIDDHLMGITHVIRGTEYLSSTPKYNLMYDAFGWERPTYIHLPPIMKDAQHKLSKRNGDASYEDFVNKGYVKEAIVNYIALLGWSPKSNVEKMSLKELSESFSLEGINKSPSIFDETKMKWLSGEYIKAMTNEEFKSLALPFLKSSKAYGKYDEDKLLAVAKGRVQIFSEIAQKVDFLEEFEKYDLNLFENQKQKASIELAKSILPEIKNTLNSVAEWNNSNLFNALVELSAKLEIKKQALLWVMRIAITGKESTAGGATEVADILGKQETLDRIDFSLNLLNKQTMVRFLFLRHGLSVTNKIGQFCGQKDAPLAPEGHVQAEQVAEYICANYKIDAIYSSDLIRVKDTIAPTAKKLNLPVTYTKNIREADVGTWAGYTVSQMEKIDPVTVARYKSGDSSTILGNAESFNDVLVRSEKEIIKIASENEGKVVLVGTHGGVIRMLCGKWLGLSDAEMRLKYPTNNASLTVVDFENGFGKIVKYAIDDYLSNPTADFSVKHFRKK